MNSSEMLKNPLVASADIWGHRDVTKILPLLLVTIAVALVILGRRSASSQDNQDKYSLKVAGPPLAGHDRD